MVTDIRVVKQKLRTELKAVRMAMPKEEQQKKDAAILKRLVTLPEYQTAKRVFVYVSTAIEVDTHALIERALADGKIVAVPRCTPGKIAMTFHQIGSFKELMPGAFGVLEPDPVKSPELRDDRQSICILPGLGYDLSGYRLGYGKGYYDRFLSRYHGVRIGLCYNGCVRERLPHGRYDRAASILVTEKFVKRLAVIEPQKEEKPSGRRVRD